MMETSSKLAHLYNCRQVIKAMKAEMVGMMTTLDSLEDYRATNSPSGWCNHVYGNLLTLDKALDKAFSEIKEKDCVGSNS